MKEFILPHLKSFKAYEPGLSIEEIKAKYGLGRIVKLASNENPLGVSPVVKEVLAKYKDYVFRYPRGGNEALKEALASFLKIPKQNLVLGNGSDEIIDLLFRLLVDPSKHKVLAFNPCFSIYKTQARLLGVKLEQVSLNPDFSFNFKELLSRVDKDTRLIFLTSPDNPSGFAAKKEEIKSFIAQLPEHTFLVLDEAYIDFADPLDSFSFLDEHKKYPRVIFLRTFSKLFGLAGLRLGYAILHEDLADYFWRIRLPFSVNILAEKAGIAVLKDEFFYRETRRVVLEGRKFLATKLEQLNCTVFPSQANFILFKPPIDAWQIFTELLKKGIIIRTLKSYGLSEYLRVSIGVEEENKLFIKELELVLKG